VHKIHLCLAAVVAMLAPLAVFGTQAPAGADVVPVTTAVRMATINVQVRRSLDQFRGGVTPLLDRSDIIGLQEMDTRDKEAYLQTLSDRGWAHYAVRPAFQTPVLWRTDRFSYLGGRVAQISPATYIGNEVRGMTSTQKARYVSVVHLYDKVTGRRVSVVNVHLVQGAVRGGRPWVGRPRLWGLYKRSLLNLASITVAEKRWGHVYVMGDFNAGWVADYKHKLRRLPVRTYSALSMRSMWAAARPTNGLGTHNDAQIDQIFSGVRPVSTAVQFDLSGFSDHRPAIATYPTS
jgi:endonuclease/exonuclease/phosphatase family metal-dependent hydrolase